MFSVSHFPVSSAWCNSNRNSHVPILWQVFDYFFKKYIFARNKESKSVVFCMPQTLSEILQRVSLSFIPGCKAVYVPYKLFPKANLWYAFKTYLYLFGPCQNTDVTAQSSDDPALKTKSLQEHFQHSCLSPLPAFHQTELPALVLHKKDINCSPLTLHCLYTCPVLLANTLVSISMFPDSLVFMKNDLHNSNFTCRCSGKLMSDTACQLSRISAAGHL